MQQNREVLPEDPIQDQDRDPQDPQKPPDRHLFATECGLVEYRGTGPIDRNVAYKLVKAALPRIKGAKEAKGCSQCAHCRRIIVSHEHLAGPRSSLAANPNEWNFSLFVQCVVRVAETESKPEGDRWRLSNKHCRSQDKPRPPGSVAA